MILGSRPVNLVWNHFPQTFGQSYLTETVFFLDSTRHLNLHEMPHLIIKCIQLVILSTCFFGIQCHCLWKTLELYYTRLLATFILKTHVFHRSSNCKNIWKLFGVILNTGFDVFLYLRYGFTYRLLFFFGGVTTHGSYTPGLQEIPFEFLMNFLWHFMIFFCIFKKSLCISYAFLMQFFCISYASLMQFFCISYAILLHVLCTSYALLMHSLCTSYAVLRQF